MSLKARLNQLERELQSGREEDVTPEDYRVGLRYYQETNRIPSPHVAPVISDKVGKARLVLEYARMQACRCGQTACKCEPIEDDQPARRPMAPNMMRWHERLPPALKALVVMDLIGSPGDHDELLQRNYINAYAMAYGEHQDARFWQAFGGVDQRVHRQVYPNKEAFHDGRSK